MTIKLQVDKRDEPIVRRYISDRKTAPQWSAVFDSPTDVRHDHRHRDRLDRHLVHRPCRDRHGPSHHHDHPPTKSRGGLGCRDSHYADGDNQGCRDNGCRPNRNRVDGLAGNNVAPEAVRSSAQAEVSNNAPVALNNSEAEALHRCAAPDSNLSCSRCRKSKHWFRKWSATPSPGRNSSLSRCNNLRDSGPAKR